MTTVLIFAIVLVLAVLVSERARRSVLSTAVMFLVAGFAGGALGVIHETAQDARIGKFIELALYTVLFTDGMRLGLKDLTSAWHLPGRALLLGFPLTLALTAVLAKVLVGFTWGESLLIGAVLSPTDPVFAAAIVGREEVPGRLRHLLNVESGLNDGLALPFVIGFLNLTGATHGGLPTALLDVGLGIVVGVVIPWIAIRLERMRYFAAARAYEPLMSVAIGILVYATATSLNANLFLAAFSAGITVTSMSDRMRERFQEFGELATELFKLGALLVFGALIPPAMFREVGALGYVFAALALLAVRPIAIALSLLKSGLSRKERVAAGWFGPKGFASAVFGLLLLSTGAPWARPAVRVISLVVVVSIIAHSSTDVLVARWFKREQPGET